MESLDASDGFDSSFSSKDRYEGELQQSDDGVIIIKWPAVPISIAGLIIQKIVGHHDFRRKSLFYPMSFLIHQTDEVPA